MQDGNTNLFSKNFMGQDSDGNWITGRCGWTHMPPNTTNHYDYENYTMVASDIADWKPEGGLTRLVNANTWGDIPYQWPGDNEVPQKIESQWYIYWMQSMPGYNNIIPYENNIMTNWWIFTANWDSAILSGKGLHTGTYPDPNNGPVFDYPQDGQILDYAGGYLFRVHSVEGADGYLWSFKQNGVMVWENYRDEGSLSTNEYAIWPDTVAHSRFIIGDVEVWVRALVNNEWTDARIITIHLQYLSVDNGSLTINIEPAEARNAGAQWRRTGTTTWYNSGATETNVPTGTHTVEFKDVSGWRKPANITVTIDADQTRTSTGTYTVSSDDDEAKATRIFNAAEELYPNWFYPTGLPVQIYRGYEYPMYYRYYEPRNIFMLTYDDVVYYYYNGRYTPWHTVNEWLTWLDNQ